MNVIIVSFPLVFHIIKLPECSCISVWALTKSIQTLCCAIIQIAHAHTYPAPHLSYQSSTMALITMINTQHRAMQGTFLFTVSVCGEFLFFFFYAALYFLCYFPQCAEKTMLLSIFKLSVALIIKFHTLAGRYNSIARNTVSCYYSISTTVRFVDCLLSSKRKMEDNIKQGCSKE